MKKYITLFALSLAIFLVFGHYFLNRLSQREEYCRKQAQSIVGNQWNIPLIPNEQEVEEQPDITYIFWGYREQRNCERQNSLFSKLH